MYLSQSELISLARDDTEKLVRIIKSGELDVVSLTYAAEYLGSEGKLSASALATLLGLSFYHSTVVREGAIYGLRNHMKDMTVRLRLQDMANTDPSPGVAEAAMNELADYRGE